MAKYVLKRLGYAVLTLFVLVTLTFFTMQLLPGDPFTGEKGSGRGFGQHQGKIWLGQTRV